MKENTKSKGTTKARAALLGKTTVATATNHRQPTQGLLQKIAAAWWVVFPLVLGVLAVFIAIRSHVPNTWLTGWDTLHPEFNFGLNLQRVLLGVFRPDQGLGSVATHAHMVELPRILLLWLMSLVIPANLLRYSYVSLCLMLGPIGIFVFTRYLLRKSSFSQATASTAAFCAGLWYLFNLGTLQHFALPFEMFPTNYAANGWLFWLLWRFLEKGRRKDLLWLVVVNFLASNMAYSFISWYVYFGGVLLVVVSIWLIRFFHRAHFGKDTFAPSRGLTALLAIITANLYWLGPNLYFVATHSWHIPFAKNNRFVSEEIFFHNKEFGTILDTISMKNHLFNWMIRDHGNYKLIFSDYIGYLQGFVGWIPLILFIVIVAGVVAGIKSLKKTEGSSSNAMWLLPMLLALVASVVAFLSLNPPLSFVFDVLRDHISIAKEGLRNPFIKFNLLLMLGYATFFAIGMAEAIEKIKSLIGQKAALSCALIFTLFLTGTLGWPFLQGKLIDPRVQLAIPTEYFELFDWLDQQPASQRVLVLPAPHFWAWDYHDWGYQGAGFMWFGIKQPFFSRDSDRWNPYNEEAYRELTTAIAADNWQLFYKLLEKYNVGYVIFDQTVSTNGEQPSVLFKNETERFLKDDSLFSEQVFSDKLAVYQTNSLKTATAPLTTLTQPSLVTPPYFWHYQDEAFNQLGNYITSVTDPNSSTYFAGRALLTKEDQLNEAIFKVENDQLKIITNTDQDLTYSLVDQEAISFNVFFRNTNGNPFIILNPILPFTKDNQDTFSTALPISLPTNHHGLFYVTINGQVFKASSDMTEDQLLGTTKLPLNNENTLNLYFNLSEEFLDHLPEEQTAVSFNCSVVSSSAETSAEYLKNGVVLHADPGSSSCVQYQFVPTDAAVDLNKTNLAQMKLSFSALDPSISNAEICIFDTETSNCLNKQSIFSLSPDREVSTALVLTELGQIDPAKTQLLLVLNNDQSSKKAALTFRTLSLNYNQPTSSQTFQVRLPDDYKNPILVANNEVAFPLNEKILSTTMADLKREVDSCGSTSKASVTREIMADSEPNYVRYSARYGQSCEKLSFDELAHDQGYVVVITSRNVSGISTRLCLRNSSSGRCDLYVPLGNQKEFKEELFVVPPTDSGVGYSAHLTTFGPGNSPSTNDISSIKIIPIPFDLVQSLRTVATPKLSPDQLIVTNGQSYENNFVAFWYKSPFSFKKISHQVLLNNWASAWQIDQSEVDQMQKDGYSLQVVFWPNTLIGLGLLPLVGTVLWLSLSRRQK